MTMTAASSPRCPRCLRRRHACLCEHVPRVKNATQIYVLQHPRERLHPFGSVPIAVLGLEKIAVDVFGEAYEHRRTWSRAVPDDALLVFPGPTARDLAEIALERRPSCLVFIDGTWPHAKSMLKQSPALAALPQARLAPKAPSLYRIRREPKPHCMSTIEAIVRALEVLEAKAEGLGDLLDSFSRMIDRHLALRAARPINPYRQKPR